MQAYKVGRILANMADYARSQSSKSEAKVAKTRHQQLELTQEITAIYQQMAPLLLQDSPDVKEVNSVQKLLDKLQQEIAQSQHALEQCEKKILTEQTQLQSLQEQIEPLEQERDRQLLANEQAQTALEAMQVAQTDTEQQYKNHNDLLAEIDPKLEEYHQQRGFMFLLKKGYGQPNYHAWLIARNLNNWLARRLNYNNNYTNYQMLHALRDRSDSNLQDALLREKQRSDIYQCIVDDTVSSLKLPPLYKQVKSTKKLLSASQKLRQTLQMTLQEFARGEGKIFGEISATLSKQLAKLPLEKLDILVTKTATPDDDRLLEDLRSLKQTELVLQETLLQLQRESQKLGLRATAATRLENEFIHGGYDSSRYEYRWGWIDNPETLFTSFLDGNISIDDVFEKLNSIARLLPTPSTSSRRSSSSSSWGSSSGSRSNSSSSGGGGFSSSSSTGGGGFRSTDSF